MIITKEWLESKGACHSGKIWVKENYPDLEGIELVKKLMSVNKLDWANWLIVRIMEKPQYLLYAIFSAEQVIDIFERQYPKEKRPRTAIEAAKNVLANDTKENRNADAAYAADAAAAYAAAASDAAYAAAASADAYAAAAAMRIKILKYGLTLLEAKP